MSDERDRAEATDMPAEVDFSASVPNPYVGRVRRRVTLNLDGANVDYFKGEADRTGVPYQILINMCLTECRERGGHLTFA